MHYISAGESHGKCISVIVEDVPCGIKLDEKEIDYELKRRSFGPGRSIRQDAETNQCNILSGVYEGKTTGANVCVVVPNTIIDSNNSEDIYPRPGHADLSGVIKYNFDDCHNVAEVASARESVARVVAGVIAKNFLADLGVEVYSYVTQIGSVEIIDKGVPSMAEVGMSELMCPDHGATHQMLDQIERAREAGDTLGGKLKLVTTGLVPGLGSYVSADKRLDSNLFSSIGSVPTVKAISFGMADYASHNVGSSVIDNVNPDLSRSTNYSGGIEGGMTNGMPILIDITCKPIPSVKKDVTTINLETYEIEKHTSMRRSDVCVVPNVAVICESEAAISLANAYMDKFGTDTVSEIKYALDAYKQRIKSFK